MRPIDVRNDVNKALEPARNEKLIGKSLDADVTIYAKGEILDLLKSVENNLDKVETSLLSDYAHACKKAAKEWQEKFRQYCEANQKIHKTKGTYCSAMRALIDFEHEYPEIAAKYFDLRFDEYCTISKEK